MAITRYGLTGPMTAYAAFQPKTALAQFHSAHVSDASARGLSVTQTRNRGTTVTVGSTRGPRVDDVESS